jgi:hypothetical protein
MIFSNDAKSLRYGGLSPYGLNGGGARADQQPAKKGNGEPRGLWGRREARRDSLILNDTNPGGLLTMARTQPDIIRGGEADFDGEMDPSPQPICMFPFEQVS